MKFFALLNAVLIGSFFEAVYAFPFVDPAFNPELNSGSQVTAFVLTEDGKMVLAGNLAAPGPNHQPGILRLQSNGDLDPFFQPASGNGMIETLLEGPGGNIFVGGRFSELSGVETHGIARLREDGRVDSGFQVAPGTGGAVRALIFANERVLAGGSFSQFGGLSATYLTEVGLDGQPDSTFAPALERSMAIEAGVQCLAVQSDGRVLVGGTFNTVGGPRQLARLNADGSMDPSFSGNHGPILYLSSIVVTEDGSILVAGLASADNTGFVRRLLAHGEVDPSFAAPDFNGIVHGICVDNQGRIVAAGKPKGEDSHGAVRLLGDGRLDPNWSVTSDGPILDLAVSGEGIFAAGAFSQIQGASRNGIALLSERKQPEFHGASANPQGAFRANLQGTVGLTYVVESSTDLSNWTTYSTNTATKAGLEIVDSEASQQSSRFFRARLVIP